VPGSGPAESDRSAMSSPPKPPCKLPIQLYDAVLSAGLEYEGSGSSSAPGLSSFLSYWRLSQGIPEPCMPDRDHRVPERVLE